ncbi:MAG: GTPase HflX [Alphaproteobacteria bacterium]|nr:MAG: GTPase HflX [Alphaproteobacteria bacterium]
MKKSDVSLVSVDKNKQTCIVIHPEHYVRKPLYSGYVSSRTHSAQLEEAEGLAAAIDLQVCHSFIQKISSPKPATYFGSGFIDHISALVSQENIPVCIINTTISPTQQRNLEKLLNCKVLDRTELILEIFGARAQSAEGSLQVELASLRHQMTRLVRAWTHLERQRGGLGFIGGPGETQLEMDKRMIRQRIQRIEKDLAKVVQTRALHRKSRQKNKIPVVALVGYTNAGKSTLFNYLTQAKVLEKDMLFATLDPTMRTVQLPSGRSCILSDTVGFIANLPHGLINAFHATLDEVNQADAIIHVRDVAHPDTNDQAREVERVLDVLDIHTPPERRLEALNKSDKLPLENRQTFADNSRQITISARTGEGIGRLLQMLDACLDYDRIMIRVLCDPGNTRLLSFLYKHTAVREIRDDSHALSVRLAIDQEIYPFIAQEVKVRGGEVCT